MNKNVNHTEKDMEQLITETLDRCMSGIDTAPSLRPVVDKKLAENPKAEKEHIPFRRLAVPAIALALCVCLIVTGTHFGMFRWPDRIRTPETIVTAQPVSLAQPEGEGGEGSPSPDGPTETSLLDNLSTVIASCENAGIRFEVHSAEVYEQHTRVLCSVQDLTGDHRIIAGGLASYPYPGFSQDVSGPSLTFHVNNGCVEEDRRIWYSLDFTYDGIDDRSDRMVTISTENIPILQENGETEDWIRETWSVQLPLKSILKDTADYPEKYSEEFFASRLSYTVNEDGTATVVGPVDNNAPFVWAALVIPETLDGHPVTSIADDAFSMFRHLESAVLPDSLTSIGARAFADCYLLEDVTFPDSLETIGDEAFSDANLQNAVLPDSVTRIGKDAFLRNMGLVCSVSEGSYAEKYCKKNSLQYVIRAGNAPAQSGSADEPVWKPGAPAETFYSLLEEMTPVIYVYEKFGIRFEVHSAEVYDTYTRVLCSLQDMEGSRILGGNPEFYPDFTQSIAKPSTTIFLNYGWIPEEHRAWYYLDFWYDGVGDRSDHAVEISASNVPLMTESGELAGRAWGPWEVYLPLKSILKDTADYPEKYSEEYFASRLSYTVNEDGTATVAGPLDEHSPFYWSTLVIPGKLDGRDVTAIADDAFADSIMLETVTLPDSITSIGARAFRGCANVYVVTLPAFLESIGDEAFRNVNLQLIDLPVTLTFIGENAFESHSPLVCVVTEGSCAEEYCKKNSIPYRIRETVTPMPPAESVQADIPDPAMAAEPAEWNSWGTTPMPPVESIQAGIPDTTAAAESAGWNDWGSTPMPPVTPEEPWRKWMADEGRGSEADTLRPVGLSSESEGIRFTVEAAAVDDESIDLLYSLEDLEGNRINEETHIWGGIDVRCSGIGENALRTNGGILHTPGRMSVRLSHYLTDGTAIPGQNLSAAFSLDKLSLLEHEIVDLSPYLAEYGEIAKAVDLDAAPHNWVFSRGENPAPLYRVLDIADPLDISLHPNVRLDGIGIIDGQCHVRLRYVDNDPVAESSDDRSFRPLDALMIVSTKPNEDFPYSARFDFQDICWSDPDGSTGEAHELVFPLEEADEIPLYIRTLTGIVDGNWKIEFPLDSIWTGPEDYAGTYTPDWYESRLTYTLNEDGTAAVSGMKEDAHQVMRRIIIPAELDGHPVTSVADCAFRDCGNLESVVLPDTVTSIGANAFAYCKQLSSVDLPEGLQAIGEEAFIDSGLLAVTIPDSVTSIGRYAFLFNPDVRFEIPQNRDLIRYCRENGIPFTIRDSEPAAEPAEVPAEKPAE